MISKQTLKVVACTLVCVAAGLSLLGFQGANTFPIRRSGVVVANNCVKWIDQRTVADAGSTCGAAAGTVTASGTLTSGQVIQGAGTSVVQASGIAAANLVVASSPTVGLAQFAAAGQTVTALSMPWITTGSNVTTNTASLIIVTANRANVQGLWHPGPQSSTKICYEIGTTADNTAATYDLGIYTGSAGGAGTLIANIGPTAGTVFAPAANGFHCINWSQGTVTIPGGRIYIATTTSQAGTAATLFGANTGFAATAMSAAVISAGGTLSALTLPVDANSGAGTTAAGTPWFSIQ